MDEAALIQDAKRGDANGVAAFNTLVLAYQTQVYHVAYRIMGEPAAAADATQEAFISAYRALSSFRGGSFKSFILRVVTNACYDALRYQKRRPSTSLEGLSENDDEGDRDVPIPSTDEDPADAAVRSDLRRQIARAIQLLPPDQRVTFVLSDVQGLSYDEIADTMQTSLGTVKSRLSRARAKLRDLLLASGELGTD